MAGIEEWLAIDLFEPQIYVLGQDAVTISVRYEERFIPIGGELTTVRGNWTVVWKPPSIKRMQQAARVFKEKVVALMRWDE